MTAETAPYAAVAQPYLDDLTIGQELPVSIRNASRVQLFLYSAATWNPHRIHYDVDYARFEGHPDVIVHGPLQGAWLSQYVTDWAGPTGRLLSLTWQNRASALPETDYQFRGQVTAIDGDASDDTGGTGQGTSGDGSFGTVSLDVWEQTTDGQILMPGRAVVRLPRRP